MIDPQVFLLWFIFTHKVHDIKKLHKMLAQALGDDNRWKRFHHLERALGRLYDFDLIDENTNVTSAGKELIESDKILRFIKNQERKEPSQ